MVLLEVLLALTLFAIAAAVVGSALRGAMRAAADMYVETQAANLAQTVLADLATGRIELTDTPATAYDAEDETWTYEIATEALDETETLQRVIVTVRHNDPAHAVTCRLTQWMLDLRAEAEQGETGP